MFFSSPTNDQVIALAGVFQACQLVDNLARTGGCLGDDFETCIHSLFEQNPSSTMAVYGDIHRLETGLSTLRKVLGDARERKNNDILRYFLGALYLQKKLLKDKAKLNRIGDGIDNARRQAGHFSETHTNVIANLADLYLNTISTFNYRIQVNGLAQHLQQPEVAKKIRCLLFAAIRSAILWHQLGGNRRQLVFQRRAIVDRIADLRRTC